MEEGRNLYVETQNTAALLLARKELSKAYFEGLEKFFLCIVKEFVDNILPADACSRKFDTAFQQVNYFCNMNCSGGTCKFVTAIFPANTADNICFAELVKDLFQILAGNILLCRYVFCLQQSLLKIFGQGQNRFESVFAFGADG